MSQPGPSIQIDSVHCAAICDEIGYRLGQLLRAEISELPQELRVLLDRLRQQDRVEMPSIVPSIEDMQLLEDA
jgi:hypothetical protein